VTSTWKKTGHGSWVEPYTNRGKGGPQRRVAGRRERMKKEADTRKGIRQQQDDEPFRWRVRLVWAIKVPKGSGKKRPRDNCGWTGQRGCGRRSYGVFET